MTIVNSCCFCLTLETGAYILGVLGVLQAFGFIVLAIVQMCRIIDGQNTNTLPVYVILLVGFEILGLLLTSMLLITATIRRNSKLILPWLLFFIISIGLAMVIKPIIFNYFETEARDQVDREENPWFSKVAAVVLDILFSFYCWLCMFSLFLKFHQKEVADFNTA